MNELTYQNGNESGLSDDVCPLCRMDDYTHVEGCPYISRDPRDPRHRSRDALRGRAVTDQEMAAIRLASENASTSALDQKLRLALFALGLPEAEFLASLGVWTSDEEAGVTAREIDIAEGPRAGNRGMPKAVHIDLGDGRSIVLALVPGDLYLWAALPKGCTVTVKGFR